MFPFGIRGIVGSMNIALLTELGWFILSTFYKHLAPNGALASPKSL